jgi:hypothetical protein
VNVAVAKTNVWVAVAVAGCLVLGAAGTWWISAAMPGPKRPARVAAVKGEPIKAPKEAVKSLTDAQAMGVRANVAETDEGDYIGVTFDTLGSFYYEMPSAADPAPAGTMPHSRTAVPSNIRAFNSRKVVVRGFILPLRVERGVLKSFMLTKDRDACCYGRVPRMNEWIQVRMGGGRTIKYVHDLPVSVFGTLEVGEKFEQGQVTSLYRMVADTVAGAMDL